MYVYAEIHAFTFSCDHLWNGLVVNKLKLFNDQKNQLPESYILQFGLYVLMKTADNTHK